MRENFESRVQTLINLHLLVRPRDRNQICRIAENLGLFEGYIRSNDKTAVLQAAHDLDLFPAAPAGGYIGPPDLSLYELAKTWRRKSPSSNASER